MSLYFALKKILAARLRPTSRRLRYIVRLSGADRRRLDSIGQFVDDQSLHWCKTVHGGTACLDNAAICVRKMLQDNAAPLLLLALSKSVLLALRLGHAELENPAVWVSMVRDSLRKLLMTSSFLVAICLTGWGSTCSLQAARRMPSTVCLAHEQSHSASEGGMTQLLKLVITPSGMSLLGTVLVSGTLVALEPVHRRRSLAIFMLMCCMASEGLIPDV